LYITAFLTVIEFKFSRIAAINFDDKKFISFSKNLLQFAKYSYYRTSFLFLITFSLLALKSWKHVNKLIVRTSGSS